jgi:hypothetical protein
MTYKGNKVNAYRGNLRPAIVMIEVVIAVHVVVAALVVDGRDVAFWVVNLVLFAMYMAFFGVMAFQATQIIVTVYETGIDWRRGGSHVFATWDNIDRIGRKDEGDAASFGIYLREAVAPAVDGWLSRRLFAGPVDYIRLIPTVRVPTTFQGRKGNVVDWQAFADTDFGRDVARYAPHLLERE